MVSLQGVMDPTADVHRGAGTTCASLGLRCVHNRGMRSDPQTCVDFVTWPRANGEASLSANHHSATVSHMSLKHCSFAGMIAMLNGDTSINDHLAMPETMLLAGCWGLGALCK